MRTRLCRITLAALVLLLLALVPARASERTDLSFDALQAWKKGEALLKEGKREEALAKLKEAEEKFTQLLSRYPDLPSRDAVDYLLKSTRAKLAELSPPPVSPPTLRPDPPPPAHTVPKEKIPYMPTVKPTPNYLLNRPAVPFIFNGETYYKMLLSHKKEQPAPPVTKGTP